MGKPPEYRADIDGLRALAILPVMCFHAGFAFARGGFVGVDVFFVISGYLITSLIHAEMVAGRFSLVGFYERRVRRLFPALFVVLLFCVVMAPWLLLPQDLRYFGGSLFSTALFSSNIFFWLETGYFDMAAESRPLLHTWSLAVEEQFYLLFPLFLALLLRYVPRQLLAAMVVCTVLFLAAGEWVLGHSEYASFYLAPFRAWELGIGAIVALAHFPKPRSSLPADLSAAVGIAFIFGSVVMFSWRTTFPGLNALLPCVGAALVIWAGSGSLVNRILASRLLVFIGLISYSMYLWHWPLLVFARHYAIRDLTSVELLAVLLASVALAVFTFHFIERPFRGRNGILERGTLFALSAAITLGVCSLGLAAVAQSGWPQRFDAETLRLLAGAEDRNPRQEACSFLVGDDLRAGKACRLGRLDGHAPSFIVLGDSQADALMPAFDRLAAERGQTGLYLGKIGCPPLLDVERVDMPFGCREFSDAARDLILASPASRIVLAARWSHYTRQPTFRHEEHVRVVIVDDASGKRGVRGNEAVLARGLDRMLGLLGSRQVYIVSTVPEIGYDVPRTLAQSHHLGRSIDIRPTLEQYRQRQSGVEAILAAAQRRHGFTRLDPVAVLCRTGRCEVEHDGRALYFDGNHLSVHGAEFVQGALEPMFQ